MTSKMIAIAAAVMALASGGAAQAAFVFNFIQSDGNVVATGNGSLNTQALTTGGGGFISSGVGSTDILIGGSTQAFEVLLSSTISGSSGYDYKLFTPANIATGDGVGIFDDGEFLTFPVGYVSGSQLHSTSTWLNQSLDSLGLNPGFYSWTWGSGANADSFTMNIGTAVPEPSSLVQMGIGGIAGLGYARRRRRAQVVA
jgi:hypothetical protein